MLLLNSYGLLRYLTHRKTEVHSWKIMRRPLLFFRPLLVSGEGSDKEQLRDSDEKDTEVLETLVHNRERSSLLERDQGGQLNRGFLVGGSPHGAQYGTTWRKCSHRLQGWVLRLHCKLNGSLCSCYVCRVVQIAGPSRTHWVVYMFALSRAVLLYVVFLMHEASQCVVSLSGQNSCGLYLSAKTDPGSVSAHSPERYSYKAVCVRRLILRGYDLRKQQCNVGLWRRRRHPSVVTTVQL